MTLRRLPTVLAAVAAAAVPAAIAHADAPWSAPSALPTAAVAVAPAAAMTSDGHAGIVTANAAGAEPRPGLVSQLVRLDATGNVLASDGLDLADPHVTTGEHDELVIAGSSLGTTGTVDDTSHIRVATTAGAGGRITIAPVHGSTGLHVDAVSADAAGAIAVIGANTRKRVVYLRTAAQREFHAVLTIQATNQARNATVALGGDGEVLVVWEDKHTLFSRHRGAKGTWGPTHAPGASIQSDLQAAIDGSGRESVAWKSQRIGEGESTTPAIVSYITAAPGHGFGTRRQIEAVAGVGGAGHYVASPGVELDVASAHHTLLTWTGFQGTDYVVRAMTITDGHRGAVQTLSPAGTDAILGDTTVVSADGPALVLWRAGVAGADPSTATTHPRLFAPRSGPRAPRSSARRRRSARPRPTRRSRRSRCWPSPRARPWRCGASCRARRRSRFVRCPSVAGPCGPGRP